jgi:hypothetical protein
MLILLFVACKEKDYSTNVPDERARITLGSTYNLNGDDYNLKYVADYDSYSEVIELTRLDSNSDTEFVEVIRLHDRLRIETDNEFNSLRKTYLNGGLKSMKTRDAVINATETNFEICRKEIVGTDYEWQCETFEEVE